LLILDEPTAAVDPGTEAELIKTFNVLKCEVPILAISHQPAVAEAADDVYALDGGRLTAGKKQPSLASASSELVKAASPV
jgi:ATP-binding cassette subfamily C protein